MTKEFENQADHVCGSLLFDRMTNAWKQHFFPKVRNASFQAVDSCVANLGYPRIIRPTNEQRRLKQLPADEKRSCFPKYVLRSIPVQSPSEAGTGELRCKVIEILRLKPSG